MTRANLCSRRNRHLRTQTRYRSTRTAKRRYLRFTQRDHQHSRAMASCTLLFPLALPILLPFPLLGARTRLLPSRLPALMMAFFGFLPTRHFSTRLPSLSSLRRSGSISTRLGPPQQASSKPVARSSPSTLWAHPLTFSSLPSPQFSSSISCPRVSSYSFPPPAIPAYASCNTSLSSSSPSSSRTMFCALSFLS